MCSLLVVVTSLASEYSRASTRDAQRQTKITRSERVLLTRVCRQHLLELFGAFGRFRMRCERRRLRRRNRTQRLQLLEHLEHRLGFVTGAREQFAARDVGFVHG